MKGNNGRKDDIQFLYHFVTEQIKSGLAKFDIIDSLEDMGVEREAAAKLIEEIEARLQEGSHKKRILVVEDEVQSRELLEEILTSAGYEVVSADDGRNALKVLREIYPKPDLILTDVLMPQMKGNDLIKELRKTILWRNIPVIVITVRSPMKDYFESLNITAFLGKPFNVEDLLTRIKNALER